MEAVALDTNPATVSEADALDWRRPKRPNSPVVGADGLTALLRTHGLKSKSQFRQWYRSKPGAPSLYRVRQAFGSWRQARCVAFGESPVIPMQIPKTDEQIVHLVEGFDIRSRRHYQRLRNAQPGLFPPMHDVIRRFGSWRTLKRLACSISFTNILTRYAILRWQLGRWPWKYECRRNGVEIDYLTKTAPLKDVKQLVVLMDRKVTEGGHC